MRGRIWTLAGMVALVVSVIAVERLTADRGSGITVDYPQEGSIFPPDFAPPTFLWRDDNTEVTRWSIEVRFADKTKPIVLQSGGPLMRVGEIDPRAVSDTNKPPELTPRQAASHTWTPDAAMWAEIQRRSVRGATVTFSRPGASGSVTIRTSQDPVGAPVFYRDVPLMPSETEKGVIKPLSEQAIPLIAWRLRNVGETKSRLLLTGMRTCANCHSFSLDGKTMGMDLDGPKNDKGLYALAAVRPKMSIRTEDMISWKPKYEEATARDRVGFMSQVSPKGDYVLTRLNGPGGASLGSTYYVTNFKDYRFLQVFYPTRGIMAWYDRASGKAQPLPGADDPRYAQADGVWSPDSRTVVFARAMAEDPYAPGAPLAEFANDPSETQIRYDLYRIPFNGGRGGRAEPIAGASANGMSNTFPKISPDGKWIVFVKCRNGQLMRPDSELWIVPVGGGVPRRMRCNTPRMNSWHSFSPNGRWLVFSSKYPSPYTQMYLTHIDENGMDSPPILIENATAANRAVNIPEFVNIPPDGLMNIEVPAVDFYRQFDVAFALSEKRNYAAAIPEWEKALTMDPEDSKAHVDLAIALMETGRTEEAIAHYRRAAEIDSGNLAVLARMGAALLEMKRPAEAVPVYEQAVKLESRDPRLASSLALALAQAGRESDAIPWFAKASELAPNDPGLHSNYGAALAGLGRMDEAIAQFRAALALRPDDASAQMNLAMTLASSGNVDEAIEHLAEAARLAPSDAGIQTNLGAALAMRGRAEEAAPHLEKALQLAPQSAEAHYHMGVTRFAQGRAADAVSEWRESVRLQPDSVVTLNRLAQALATSSDASLRNGAEAVELAERASNLAGGQDAALLDTLGAAYAEARRFADALNAARRALEIAVRNGDTRLADGLRARIALYEAKTPFRVN